MGENRIGMEQAWVSQNGYYGVSGWVMRYPTLRAERAAVTAVALEEHVCAALVEESDPPDLKGQPEPEGWYRRGREKRRKLLSKAKSDLARHLRNQAKWGGGGGGAGLKGA